jgi:HEAT repeat protein
MNRAHTVVLVAIASLAAATGASAQQGATSRQVPVESLIYDLKNPDNARRREAATLIGTNKIKSATPDLVAAAKDVDPAVRRAIVQALQQVEDPRSLDGFLALSDDTERDIRTSALEGMTRLYLPRETGLVVTLNRVGAFLNPWSDEWADVIVEPDLPVDPRVISAIEARLRDPEESLRIKAARALGILRGRAATPALVLALKEDRSNVVRFESVRALRKLGDPAVGPDLLTLITYGDAKVRNEAIYTIGRLRYRPALEEMTRRYEAELALPAKNADRTYLERLGGAIAFIGEPSSQALFARERGNVDRNLALHAYEGLARVGDKSLETEVSAERLKETDPKIRAAQAFALYRYGRKEYLDELVRALGTRRTNAEAREYLLELRRDELPDLLAKAASTTDVDVREAIAEILGQIGDPSAVPTLQELQRDTRGQVAALASQALRRVQPKGSE